MKKYFFAFACSLPLFFSSLPASAVTIDLEKFRTKARAESQKLIGDNLVGNGIVYFRDGAGSTDLEPIFDHGGFYYVMEIKAGLLPDRELRLAYRVNLNGSEDFVLLPDPGQNPEFAVSMPGDGIVSFKANTSRKSVDALLAKLTGVVPNGDFTYLKNLKLLTFHVPVTQAPAILEELYRSSIVATVNLNYEVYRTPFFFDLAVLVADSGQIDADKYRGITKKLKEEGRRFASETKVPEDLQ